MTPQAFPLPGLISNIRESLESDNFTTRAYLGQRLSEESASIAMVPLTGTKEQRAEHLRTVVRIQSPEFVLLALEGYSLGAKFAHLYEEMMRKYGSLSQCPHAAEVLSLTFEAKDENGKIAYWIGNVTLRPLGLSKKKRTFAPASISWQQGDAAGGLFGGLL